MKENGRKQLGGRVAAASSSSSSPCAACKLLRRRCAPQDCVFAPYFPADEPHKFSNVHKVFGASNVNKMLQELPEQQRGDAVSSMVYEANARVRDPVYGCVGAISSLQQQIDVLQAQLALAQAEVVHLTVRHSASAAAAASRSRSSQAINNSPTNSGSPSSSSSKITASQAKPFFVEMDMDMDMNIEMAAEQAAASFGGGESMWS